MNKIMVMDTQLSNMIAAGEVVERPASVVKELVENALDAGATKIELHLQDSGLNQIKIIDNGSGMNPQDAKLAFERHATSKVRSAHDIMRISTLGFRGEALPSIAAVADVHLKTSDGESEGHYVHIKGGQVMSETPFAIRKGTEIEVNHLFFNTPARLKHMKSMNTELSHVTEYLTKTALANPQVAIALFNNKREVLKTPGNADVQAVTSRIYGFDIAKKMHGFEAANEDFKLSGVIGAPDVTRASRNYVTFIVNGRPIKNFELVRTVVEAYHTYLPKDRFPIVVMNIDVDPLLVDVNVHPAKIEVRFSKEEALKAFILTETRRALQNLTYIPEATPSTRKSPKVTYEQPSLLTSRVNKQSLTRYDDAQGNTENSANLWVLRDHSSTYEAPVIEEKNQVKEEKQPEVTESVEQVTIHVPIAEAAPNLELYYIGQFQGTYLLAQNSEGLFLIDQHAAQERVEYEKNLPLLGSADASSMELLVPITLSYPMSDLVRLKEHLPRLVEFGFDVEEFGENDLIVRKAPVWAKNDAKSVIETMITVILSEKEVNLAKLREEVAIMMSCKKSIKANQYINENEVKALLEALCRCEQPYTCPHGRPVIVKMTHYEIERLFKRS